MANPRILKWMHRCNAVGGIEGVERLILKFQGEGASTAPLMSKEWPPTGGLTSDDYVNDFYAAAVDDASGLPPGVHTYQIVAYGKKNAMLSRIAFKVAAEDTNESLATEGPNAAGLTGQAMRHVEAIMRTVVPAWTEIMRSQQREAERKDNYITRLEKTHLKTVETQEELMSKLHERELAFAEERRKQELVDEGLDLARTYIPAALSLAGKKYKVLPEQSGAQLDPRLGLAKQLMTTFTAEQTEKLQQILKGDQLLAFYELYQGLQEESIKDIDKAEAKSESAAEKVRRRMKGDSDNKPPANGSVSS